VLILGAAGRSGRAALDHLCLGEGPEEILLADRDAEGLVKLAAYPSPVPLRLRYLEAESEAGLRRRVSECQVVLGCLGPFHQHEERVVEAVLAEGRDYLSLCDDSAVTRRVLARAGEAEQRGVRIILGCGMTPGISNLLACRAAARLDAAESVRFAWWFGGGLKAGPATVKHLLHSLSGKSELLREGRTARVRSGSWGEPVEFPPPVGTRYLYHLDHPETVTVPVVLRGLRHTWFKAGCGDPVQDIAAQTLAWLGMEWCVDLLSHLLTLTATGRPGTAGSSCPSALRVTAEGIRGGSRRRVHLAVCGDYYRLTGAFVAACLEWLREERPAAGIYTPEMVMDGPSFYRRLGRRGVRFLAGEEGAPEVKGG